MSNKCQIYYTPNNKCHISKAIKMPNRWSLSECQLKYTGKGVNLNTNGQIIMKGNPSLPEQSVNAFIEEKQYEITVHMSSNFYYRNADENINVRNSKGTTVSHSHFRSRREGEPHSMVTRLFNRKKKKKKKQKNSVKLYVKKCVPNSSILKAMLWGYHHHHSSE